jgi:hypothetical protein
MWKYSEERERERRREYKGNFVTANICEQSAKKNKKKNADGTALLGTIII